MVWVSASGSVGESGGGLLPAQVVALLIEKPADCAADCERQASPLRVTPEVPARSMPIEPSFVVPVPPVRVRRTAMYGLFGVVTEKLSTKDVPALVTVMSQVSRTSTL